MCIQAAAYRQVRPEPNPARGTPSDLTCTLT